MGKGPLNGYPIDLETMEKINSILKRTLAKKGLLRAATSAEICFYASQWSKGRFTTISCSRGVLKVSVQGSCAASELQMEEGKLIRHLNEKFGVETVKKLKIINSQ